MRLIDVSAALPSAVDPAWVAARGARRRAEEVIGITTGIRCAIEPERITSPEEIERENDLRRAEAIADGERTAWYVAVSPAVPAHARREILEASDAVAVELVGPLDADAPAIDDIVAEAVRRQLPVRCASADVLAALAPRHPAARLILARLGDGGRWHSALNTVAPLTNVLVDVSGRVAERGMLDAVLFELGPKRVLWGTGGAMESGLAQLRALAVIGPGDETVEAIRWGNAARVFRFAGARPR